MIDPPGITRTPEQPTAVLHLTVPRGEIQDVMGPGLGELTAAVKAQGVATPGAWFTHHFRMDPETFDFEIGVVVERPITAAGRVQPSRWPAGRVARTIYRGPYEALGDAWGEFQGWIDGEGLRVAPDLWERYLAGPESGPDPTTWKTELTKPLDG